MSKPWETTHHVTIPCYEGVPGGEDTIYAPPGKVVEVCVVADRAFLALCEYEEDHGSATTKVTADIHVDASALLNALIAQMDVERVRLAVPFPLEGSPA